MWCERSGIRKAQTLYNAYVLYSNVAVVGTIGVIHSFRQAVDCAERQQQKFPVFSQLQPVTVKKAKSCDIKRHDYSPTSHWPSFIYS